MSLCSVDLDWADGRYTFALPLAQLEELEQKCDAGLVVIFNRLLKSEWLARDIHETVRLGLIGGGLSPAEAMKLTRRYVLDRPWLENVMVAASIIGGAINGKPEEPLGKAKAGTEMPAAPAATEGSISGKSTASVQ